MLVSQFPPVTSASHAPHLPIVAVCLPDSSALLPFTRRSFDLPFPLATIKFALVISFALESIGLQ